MADENPLLVGNRALSRTGHAAVAMKGTDNKWINIQTNTFNNWINEQLREAGLHVENFEDFYDGVILCALVETLQRKHIGKVIKKPTNHHQMLHNANLALTAISGDKVKLVNIGPEDIINGNGKLILGLVWQLILRYQIGRSKFLPKNLIAWLRAVIPQCNITNFTKDWNDGVALHALIDYCKPGISPEWNKLERTKSLENCQHGMELAKKNFNIPLVLRPEDLSSNELDELSGMTYLSYYAKEDSPGYHATLNWVREVLNENVNNFTTDWNDGTILGKLVSAMGAEIPPLTGSNINKLQQAIDGGKSLGVEPILSAKEMADIEVEHLGIMAYAARFGHLKPIKLASECVKFTANLNNVNVGSESNFSLKILEDSLNHNNLMVEIKGPTASVPEHLIWHGDTVKGRFTVTEPGAHYINVLWKKQVIKDCPVHFVTVVDTGKIKIDHPNHMTVGNPEEIKLDMSFAGQGELCVEATSPGGCIYDLPLTPHKGQSVAKFLPQEPGEWRVKVMCDGDAIPGNPFTVKVIDPVAVSVYGLNGGAVGTPCAFSVDCSKAGESKLKVDITHNENYVPSNLVDIGGRIYNVEFTPPMAGEYNVNVVYGDTSVKGSPFNLSIVDSNMVRFNWSGDKLIPIDQSQSFSIDTSNAGEGEVHCAITAPSGETIACDILPQADGDYKVQWTPTIPGRYTIDVLFGGKQIQGSPFYVDVFDISKIRVGHIKTTMVGETATFDIDFGDAGKAEYALQIIGPSGTGNIAYNVEEKEDGLRVTFNPTEHGRYKVYVTYGGLDVPDCPIIIDVEDGGMPTAYGDGLVKGEEDKLTTFFVDASNLRGELAVQVEGPNSIAKCTIEERSKGTFAVSYIPVEVGMYNVVVKWNGKEIPGSPYHAGIVDARKVRVIGGWQHYMDHNDKVHLVTGEEKRIGFDVSDAGPGLLSAKVVGPSGALVPVHVDNSADNKATVIFMAKEEGAHYMHINWSDHPLVNSPFLAHSHASSKLNPDLTKVVLSGRGLKEAITHEKAEFHIDGSEAGPGKPDVRLEGVKRSIEAHLIPTGPGQYKCEYTADMAGAYLLHISWNGRTLRGSPFKVNVLQAGHSQKIQVSGEGLRGGMIGKDINVMIDTRHAGKGELSAHCMGPNLVANCNLTDMRDGTYKLSIHPQEAGRHTLHIKYGGEHVFGSPYVLMIYAQPDASKVRVSGPGVEHGLLATYHSRLIVETKGAGAGQLTVRIKGPKGAFQVEMIRETQKDRTIMCQYDPTETGIYIVQVRWSDVDVPGSPFYVHIVDSHSDLEKVLNEENGTLNQSGYWREEF